MISYIFLISTNQSATRVRARCQEFSQNGVLRPLISLLVVLPYIVDLSLLYYDSVKLVFIGGGGRGSSNESA